MSTIAMMSVYLPSGSKIGSGYQAHYMANALARRGHAVTMFSPCDRPDTAEYQHHRVDVGTKNTIFRFAREIGRLDLSGFDVVHAHGEDYLLFGRRRPRGVHVRTMHGSCLAEAVKVPGLKEKLRMAFIGLTEVAATAVADRTVAVSADTLKYYPGLKDVIPNGVDLTAFHPGDPDVREPVPTILFVGTYQNRKRGKLLMEAFERTIRPAVPNVQLWMVCSDAPAAPAVTVTGSVTTEKLADLYRRAWAFCLPSSYEGFGVPYIEAMASGTPVVATPNPGAVEVLQNGKLGVLVEPDQLGDALVKLLNDEPRRRQLSADGLVAAERYGWDRVAAEYERLYVELAAKRSTGVAALAAAGGG
jgi:glycosyltransferase involved in cell wall biosynthesis